MNRATGRWLAMGTLAAAVIALAVYTSAANRRLIDGLTRGSNDSFEALAGRQDAYIFLQSESATTRVEIAERLGGWNDDRAAKLAILLIPDPEPSVRTRLAESLKLIAARSPGAVAAEFGAGGAAESGALIEAASADNKVGIRILGLVLEKQPSAANAYLLAKRIGTDAAPELMEVLKLGDDASALLAADALAGLTYPSPQEASVAQTVLRRYQNSKTQSIKDKLLPTLARFAPEGGRGVFFETAFDETAPTDLRVAAARALKKLKDPSVGKLTSDPDTSVAAAANGL